MTVRQIIQALVRGELTQGQAEDALRRHTDWDAPTPETPAMRHGLEDTPLATDNSPEQIDLAGGSLPRDRRRALWRAAGRG